MLKRMKLPGVLCALAFLSLIPLTGWGTAVSAIALAAYAAAFGFDNMVVIAPFVQKLGRWRVLYRTIGMLVAISVQLLGPTLLAALVTKTSPRNLLVEAFTEPTVYGTALEPVHPQLMAFSGPFFVLTCVWHFAEGSKHPWLRPVEDTLKRRGRFCRMVALVVTLAAIAAGTVDYGPVFGAAGIVGTAFFLLLDFGKKKFIKDDEGRPVDRAIDAIRLFLVIEAIECAFSIDTMVGAVAISPAIVAVLVGLTAGVLLMRTAVVHVAETNKLDQLVYVESGAHWSMGLLGVLMLLGPWVDTPAWLEEISGGVFIVAALIHSVLRNRRMA